MRYLSKALQVIALSLGVAGMATAATAKRPPNVVFILVDDMGWRDLGCFGSKFYQTPQIDALASSGTRFTQAYAACAVCSPTRAALMTGKSPARLHITDWIPGLGPPRDSRFTPPDWTRYLPLEETTIAEALKKQGYATMHLGKWHLGGGKYLPEHQGFDINIGGGANGDVPSYFWPYGGLKSLTDRGGKEGDYLTDQLTDEALRFIEENKSRPFYLNFCHYAVHVPLMGKQSLIDKAKDVAPADGQSNKTYWAMVSSVDESVGRVMKKLEELHLTENTLIVFTSDNGGVTHFGNPPVTSNQPLRLGKGTAYEGGLRVPLIIKAPGSMARAGSVCEAPVITMDFFPTLLELAGADKSASRTALDGKSLVPLLRGGKAPTHDALFWHYPHYGGKPLSPYSVVHAGDWKLIRFYETGTEELYNLKTDLSEAHNLADTEPTKRKSLSNRLDAWLKESGAQMPIPRPTP